MNGIDKYHEMIREIWLKRTNLVPITKHLDVKEFSEEMTKVNEAIKHCFKRNDNLCSSIVGDEEEIYNYFLVSDIGYGGACEKCGTDSLVILLVDKEYDKNLDEKIFLPCMESYMTKRKYNNIIEMIKDHPVPVNPNTDYWYCPNCKELHKFKYELPFGLMYDQEVVKE